MLQLVEQFPSAQKESQSAYTGRNAEIREGCWPLACLGAALALNKPSRPALCADLTSTAQLTDAASPPDTTMAQMRTGAPTDTERNMEKIITIFQRYAGKGGDKCEMDYKEFKDFMDVELGSFTYNQKDQNLLKRMMDSIDTNQDHQLDFQEFFNLIGGIMVACHDALCKFPDKKPAPQKRPPTEMETTMESIIRTFQHYAGKKGEKNQMNYTEFEGFMKAELRSFTENQKDPDVVRKLMKSVDGSVEGVQNQELDFQEFLNLIGGMMVACHSALCKSTKVQ
ncbi:uncharacterized protein O3C94_012845 [Discoglossus pictus]